MSGADVSQAGAGAVGPDGTIGVGVLVSGRGSNLQALLDAERGAGSSALGPGAAAVGSALGPARVRVVVSNVAGAGALARAEAAGVPAVVLDHRPFAGDRAAFERALCDILAEHGVRIVVLAGFMRLLGPTFLAAYADRTLNVHPSLLPAFPGMHALRQALDYGARVTGCTIHLVDEGCDTGPVLLQAAVPILDDDDEERLGARVRAEEHRLYPQAVRLLAEGRVRRQGRRLIIS